jgi:hypothetical protein
MPKRPQIPPLTERDEQILVLLYRYRFLTAELLWHLIHAKGYNPEPAGVRGQDGKVRPQTYGFGLQALYKRLRKLHTAGLIDRQYLYPGIRTTLQGAPAAVFSLFPKSAPVLSAILKLEAPTVRAGIRRSAVETPYLRHELGISRFRAILELASAKNPDRLELVDWRQGRELGGKVTVRQEGNPKGGYSVYPDAAFSLLFPTGQRKLFFLEFDRGTEPLVAHASRSNLRDKFIGYYHYRKSGLFARQYSGHASGFNVLFAMPESRSTFGRIDNSIKLLKSMGVVFRSSGLFWFAPESAIDIGNPTSVATSIWKTAAGPALKSITD